VFPLEFRPAGEPLVPGEPVTVLGYSEGLPLKVHEGGVVTDPRAAELDYFVTNSDAFQGNSGAPVLDAQLRLVGVQTGGAADYESGSGCTLPVRLSDTSEAAVEQSTYVGRALAGLCDAEPEHALCCEVDCAAHPGPTCSSGPGSTRGSAWPGAFLLCLTARLRRYPHGPRFPPTTS
jgi:hypothetical protein